MINVATRTGLFTPTRSYTWSETISALDANGNVPDNIASVKYVLQWRDLEGRLFEGASAVSANQFTISIGAAYMNPATTNLTLECYWILTDTQVQKFAEFAVEVQDISLTGSTPAAPSSAPRTYYFHRIGLAVLDVLDEAYPCPSGGGSFRVQNIGAGVAPVGSGITFSLEAAGVPTGDTWVLPDGERQATSADIVTLSAGVLYSIRLTAIGTTSPGEEPYALFEFYPA